MNVGGAAGEEWDTAVVSLWFSTVSQRCQHILEKSTPPVVSLWFFTVSRRYQHTLDKSTPHVLRRWILLAVIVLIYALRVYFVGFGFYIITWVLGIYIIKLLLVAFLSPQVDPEINELVSDDDGPSLPTRNSDEFRPFVRLLPEFKFWYALTKAFCIAFVLTFFSALDIPINGSVILLYLLVLFIVTMIKQIFHMFKYRYVPFTLGKKQVKFSTSLSLFYIMGVSFPFKLL